MDPVLQELPVQIPALHKQPVSTTIEVKDESKQQEEYRLYGPDFEIQLTLIDQSLNGYPRFGWVLQLPADYNADNVIDIFKAALQRVVRKIPWLAAYVKPSGHYPGLFPGLFKTILREIFGIKLDPEVIRRSKPQWDIVPGPLILNVRRSNPGMIYSKMSEADFVQKYYPEYPKTTKEHGVERPAIAFHLNFTDDGFLLVTLAFHHALMDCTSIGAVLELLASECRLGQEGQTDIKPAVIPVTMDRSAVQNLVPDIVPEKPSHPWMKLYTKRDFLHDFTKMVWQAGTKEPVERSVRIYAPAITEALNAWKTADPTLPKITSHDFACAMLWRTVMSARANVGLIRPDAIVNFAQPVDIRRFLPTTKPPFLGNALTIVRCEMPLQALLDPQFGLRDAAVLIRRTILQVSESNFRAQLGLYVAAHDLNFVQVPSLADRSVHSIVLTSWHRFPIADLQWGPAFGRYAGFYGPASGRPNGFFCVMPGLPDGSVTTCIALDAKVLAALDRDEDLRRYAKCADMGPKEVLAEILPSAVG